MFRLAKQKAANIYRDRSVGLLKADLGPWCACETVPLWSNSHVPLEDHPLVARREPFALEDWILESLYCDPKGSGLFCGSFLRKGEVFAYVEIF